MKLVKQKHPRGCVVACLAMIVNLDYDTVLKETCIDPNFGAYQWQWIEYLRIKQFTGRWQCYVPQKEPPTTWAAVHLCYRMEDAVSNIGHMVVVRNGDTVFDPLENTVLKYKTLEHVKMLASIYSKEHRRARFGGLNI